MLTRVNFAFLLSLYSSFLACSVIANGNDGIDRFKTNGEILSVKKIIQGLSLVEKIGQMTQIDISVFFDSSSGKLDEDKLRYYIKNYRIGSILNSPFSSGPVQASVESGLSASSYGWSASEWRNVISTIQKINQEEGSVVPIIYGIDTIHGGTFVYGSALYPQAIGMAATFNNDIVYKVGKVSSKDTRAAGIPWLFAPVLGLGLHPNWARFPETFGEDSYLASELGKSIILGIQDVIPDGGIPRQAAACMKHFIGYSDPVSGHDRSPVELSDRSMQQLYRPSFQAAIDAGVMTAMEAYHEIGGVPLVSSSQYLKTLLRTQMGFDGMMVTDYSEIKNLHDWHKVASTQKAAVEMAILNTSIDMSMVPLDNSFSSYLLELVEEGAIDESRIDESVERVLETKRLLGLFADPIPPLDDPLLVTVGQSSDWELSLSAARESIVLLENRNDILPLPASTKVFVTGPTADSLPSLTGGWSYHWQGAVKNDEFTRGDTVIDGIRRYAGFHDEVTYYAGPSVDAEDLSDVDLGLAMKMAEAADVVLLCLGEGTYAEKPGDIDSLDLMSGQLEYASVLLETGKPVILLLVEGRPRLLHGLAERSAAVLLAPIPGPMGGQAIAELIVGSVVPSARLPFTYPKNAGDIPYTYHRKPGDMCTDKTNHFKYVPCQVEWEFGRGLSYTTFSYSSLDLSASRIALKHGVSPENNAPFSLKQHDSMKYISSLLSPEYLEVSVNVKNTGGLAADHTVMLFLTDVYRRVTPEYKLLKRYSKVNLAPGEEKRLSWKLSVDDFKYIGLESRYVLESGEFRVAIGHETDCRDDGSWESNPLCASFQLELQSKPTGSKGSRKEANAAAVVYSPVCEEACSILLRSENNQIFCSAKGGFATPFSQSLDASYSREGKQTTQAEIAANNCRNLCSKQNWGWSYVSCLEGYIAKGGCNAKSNTLQCYDPLLAAAKSSPPSYDESKEGAGSGCDPAGYLAFSAMLVFTALSAFLVGSLYSPRILAAADPHFGKGSLPEEDHISDSSTSGNNLDKSGSSASLFHTIDDRHRPVPSESIGVVYTSLRADLDDI